MAEVSGMEFFIRNMYVILDQLLTVFKLDTIWNGGVSHTEISSLQP